MPDRPCVEQGCAIPADPHAQRCGWHRLARTKLVEQEEASARRLAVASARPGFVPVMRVKKETAALALSRGVRFCPGCQAYVPLWYFAASRCKPCARIQARASRTNRVYGVDAGTQEALLALQRGKCAICRTRPRSKALAMDHDHQSLDARGYLCKSCNHDLLGAAHDSLEILRNAVYYLENPPTSGRWTPPEDSEPIPY